GSRGGILPELQEFTPRIADLGMRLGRDLDLRLQEFALDASGGAEIGRAKQRVGGFARRLKSLGVGEEIFLLNAELEGAVGHETRRAIRRGERTGTKSFVGRIEPELHGLR